MNVLLSELRNCIRNVLSEQSITPTDADVNLGELFLALINNQWTPVKVTGVKIGLDDEGNPDPNRKLYQLKLLGSAYTIGQTRPAMSLRSIASNLKGKPSKFGKKYTKVRGIGSLTK